jgi:hypothetical protein
MPVESAFKRKTYTSGFPKNPQLAASTSEEPTATGKATE